MTELEKLEQAIAAVRGILSGAALDAALAPLLAQRAALLAGSGALAQGEGATALGERAVQAENVGGHVITGDGNIINPDPAQAEATRAEQRYLQRLYQHCNVLPLAAMGGEEGVGDEVTLEQVYVALDTQTRAPLTKEEKAQRANRPTLDDRGDTRPLTALEVATQTPRLALLGDPGSGKSTFVRQLTAWLAAVRLGRRGPLPGWKPELLPVLVVLRELAPHLAALNLERCASADRDARLVAAVRTFWTAALRAGKAEAWDSCLEDALLAGKVVLIFDGLDEVPEANRVRVRQAVAALLREYSAVQRVIVTCRVRSYTGAAVLPGFTAHTLAPFDEEKIAGFVTAWYRAQAALGRLTEERATERAQDLHQAAKNAELRELSSNPMLLTTMALIHQREVGLPRERVRLYALAVHILLNRWQQRKGLAVSDALAALLGDDLKLRALLERLAYEAHQRQTQQTGSDLPRKDLLVLLEDPTYLGNVGLAAEFLDYVDQRAGLLVGQGGDADRQQPQTYTFPHRTFQEYLAGCYLVGQRGTARAYRQRAEQGDYWYLAAALGAEELFYNRRSVNELLDLAYALCPETEPANEPAWRALVWSGQMAALVGTDLICRDVEHPDGGAAYLERLFPRLTRILRETPLKAIERATAGQALAKLGDPRRGVGTAHPALPDILWVEIPAGPFLMGEEKEQHPVTLPTYYIARYPVTQTQFATFVQAGGYAEARYWPEAQAAGVWREGKVKGRWDDEPRIGPEPFSEPYNLPNHPVVGVTWYEALAFGRWVEEPLQVESSKLPVWQAGQVVEVDFGPGALTVRLPSEAEWEKAAAWVPPSVSPGGGEAEGGRKRRYPWGDKADPERANYDQTGIGTTSAVGAFPDGVSAYGVEEMSGNVWEWTRSRYKEYPYQADDGREDATGGDDVSRVLRGGAFSYNVVDARCAYRDRSNPYFHSGDVGFRVVVASPFSSPLDAAASEL